VDLENDVTVVGAGLAGLLCARLLQRSGLDTLVLEASDAVGGRVRTDVVDGFRCDRGFQLLNPAYPAVRRHVDLEALDLQVFGRGVEVVRDDEVALLADPARHPGALAGTLRSGYVRPAELARLGRWIAPSLGNVDRLLARPDRTLAEDWAESGVDGRLRREVLAPFLTGVLADDREETSATYVRLVMRSFLRATPGVPAGGMQAFADQVGALPAGTVRLGTRVEAVRRSGRESVVTADGTTVRSRAVVVATDAPAAGGLLDRPAPAMRGLATWWFATDEPPTDATFLRIDGRRDGPVVNTTVMTNTAPSYAPSGRHLIQATTLLPSDATEPEVRRHLARLWSADAEGWELVTRHDVHHALPALPPPLVLPQPARVSRGIYVAGDHRETPSIQGALVSGAHTAQAVLSDLRLT
jgi:phytoene dehydrogenase-like protein